MKGLKIACQEFPISDHDHCDSLSQGIMVLTGNRNTHKKKSPQFTAEIEIIFKNRKFCDEVSRCFCMKCNQV